jgi:RHS repeat-associated protein
MLFAAAQITGYMWLERRAQKKAVESAQLIPNTKNDTSPVMLNPDFKDPRVKPTQITPDFKPEAEEAFKPQISEVTEAAKRTALLKDPVEEYFDQRQANGGRATVLEDQEIKSERTATTNTYRNDDGSETVRTFAGPVNFKKGKAWQPIEGTIKDDGDYNQSVGFKSSVLDKFTQKELRSKRAFRQDDGLLKLNFKPLSQDQASVSVADDKDKNTKLDIKPLGTSNASPVLQTAGDGTEYVEYKDAWKDADLYYEQRGASLKEYISLKSAEVPTTFSFRVKGATLAFGKSADGKLDGTVVATQSNGTQVVMPALTLSSTKTGPISDPPLKYALKGDVVSIVLDKTWLKGQKAGTFPLVIDPTYAYYTYYHTGVPGGDLGQFTAYKSDGYVCNSTNCDMYAGSLNDRGLKSWRTEFHVPFMDVYGKNVTGASIYTERINRPYAWSGFEGNRTYWATWAHCFGYNCRSGAPQAAGNIDWGGYLDATGLMQWASNNNVGDGWLMMWGNEGDIQSFKAFSGAHTYLDVQYYNVAQNRRTDLPTLAAPAANASIMVNRPTLKMNPVSDPDGDLVRYSFHLLDTKGNILAYAGELDAPSWTIPDGILADGEKYFWRGFVMERNAGNPSIVESGWRQTNETRQFTFELRTGKDMTQTYDDVGPVSVNLNTGNMYGSFPTHSMTALGGDIGLSLDYNTPNLVRPGLTAKYFNNNTATGSPAITVQDPNVDMNWGTSSPYPGVVQADNFSVIWSGFFKAPMDGTYTFGSTRDDKMKMDMKVPSTATTATTIFDHSCCGTTWGSSVSLVKGQTYGVTITSTEYTGAAYAQLLVRTPDSVERVVPSEWLASSSTPVDGMTARFYKNTDPVANPNFVVNDTTPLVFSTVVPQVYKDWGSNSLVPVDVGGQYVDNMIANYSGYITFPYTGDYTIGGASNDGMKIRLGGQEILSRTSSGSGFAPTIHFEGGETVSLQVDYTEKTGTALVNLQWQGPGGTGTIPAQYLTGSPKSVPTGWTISVDPNGDIPYETLKVNADGSVQMIDSTGFTHVYTWNDGAKAFKPPVNEDGYLVKNDDNSYTLTDVDGRVYSFSAEGVILSVTSPADDKNPAGLRYEYRNTSTSIYSPQPRLHKIIDGVDPSRYGRLYYFGENDTNGNCMFDGSVPYSTVPPAGALCAFKTFPDNKVTTIHYASKSLERIQTPGLAKTSFKYAGASTLNTILDPIDNDTLAAGVTASTVIGTGVSYDALSRVKSVGSAPPSGGKITLPAGQSNNGQSHTFEYGFQSTKWHVSGDPEPNGYAKYIEYDNLFRTTKACDNAALCSTTEWDPVKDLALSSTEPTGLKTTTLYDEDDRPTAQYGAAPAAWFGSDRKPLPAYTSQVPKTETKYDEGITGPAVAWYAARGQSLFGAPKLHSTGIDNASAVHIGRDFQPSGSVPVTTDTTTPGYGFSATGKIVFPQSGIYTFRIPHDDGARLYVNDNLIVDDWTTRTNGATQSSPEGTFSAEAGKPYRFRFDYIHFDDGSGPGLVDAWLRGPSIADVSGNDYGTNQFGNMITPAYGLITSRTTGDNHLGDTVVKTNYSGDPAYGLATSTVVDPTGLNYTNQATYEAQGTGYARQLSKTSSGGNTTEYQYYGATETVDNPCTEAVDPASQAGRIKLRVESDPDGAGPQTARTAQIIYDNSGQEIAARTNQDPWTCTEFDVRGRVTKVTTPAVMDGSTVVRAGKIVTTNYAYGGNPLVTTVQDEAGLFTLEERDMHDRVFRRVDLNGDTTTTLYDALNRPLSKASILGTETITYNNLGRPTAYAVDGVTYATMTYDQYGRLQNVEYPQAKNAMGNKLKLDQINYDSLLRDSGNVFKFSDNTTFSEAVTRSTGGLVLSSTDNLRGVQAASTYTYDRAARLTQAVIDNMKYEYDFSAPNSAVCDQPSANLNAHKNANRTTYTATNLTTSQVTASSTYCYDKADRLIGASDVQIGTPTYDDHGNIVTLAGNGTPITFTYNNADQNTAITQGGNKIEYVRTVEDAVLRKKEYQNNVLTKSYRYADGGRVLQSCSLTDANACTTLDTYLTLPGGVTLTLTPTHPDTNKRSTYSVRNFHGDTALTVGGDGLPTSSVFLYEPFGQASPSQTFGTSSNPGNSSNEGMGWAANPARKQEALISVPIIQMGARTYLPSLGRFLQPDPLEGGNPNAYAYPGDPVNNNDYSGNFGFLIPLIILAIRLAPIIARVVPIVVRVIAAVVTAVKAAATIARSPAAPAAIKAASSASNATRAANTVRGVSAAGAKASSAAGRASEGYKGISIQQAPKSPGVYQFTQSNGQLYTGMTTRPITARLQEHVATGKLVQGMPVRTMDMSGASRLQIRVQEQTWLNQAGGLGNPNNGNLINSVAPKYWKELGIPPF